MNPSEKPVSHVGPPFAFNDAAGRFQTAMHQEVARSIHAAMTQHIPERNLQLYSHGRGWSYPTASGESVQSEFQLCSVPTAIAIPDIIAADLEAIPRYIEEAACKFQAETLTRLSARVESVTQQTGNVVTWGKGRSAADAFLELIQKVDFGVDENGKVTLPEFMNTDPKFFAELTEYQAAHPEFTQKVDEIKTKKAQEALQREAARKARFKKAK